MKTFLSRFPTFISDNIVAPNHTAIALKLDQDLLTLGQNQLVREDKPQTNICEHTLRPTHWFAEWENSNTVKHPERRQRTHNNTAFESKQRKDLQHVRGLSSCPPSHLKARLLSGRKQAQLLFLDVEQRRDPIFFSPMNWNWNISNNDMTSDFLERFSLQNEVVIREKFVSCSVVSRAETTTTLG